MTRASLLLLILPLSSCGTQTMMGRDGAQSAAFADLFWIFLAVTLFFWLLVFAFLIAAILRRRGERKDGLPDTAETGEGPLRPILYVWVVVISLALAGLTVASWLGDRSLARAAQAPELHIEVTANQWWWDVEYSGATPDQNIRTANELHLPAGVPVRITLHSNDVIHSFWIPNLAGKQDLVPGRESEITLTPRNVGRYRGQCAEFCGLQHAHMALDVTVESEADFQAWWRSQSAPAPAPSNPLQLAGYTYVTQRECGACHNIVGTPASGQVAPDLTHLASRRSIGAGTYPMTRGHLYAWIADPQSAKPGNHMPYIGLEPAELHAIVAYLETLR